MSALRFEVLMAVNIRMTVVFWDVMSYSFVDGEEFLEEAAVSIFRVKWAHLLYPEDGDNNFI
jgi:hypothetical protein